MGQDLTVDRSAIRDSLDAERAQVLARDAALKADLEGIIANSMDANADDEHDPEGSTVAFERAQVIARISEAESASGRAGACSGTVGHR